MRQLLILFLLVTAMTTFVGSCSGTSDRDESSTPTVIPAGTPTPPPEGTPPEGAPAPPPGGAGKCASPHHDAGPRNTFVRSDAGHHREP